MKRTILAFLFATSLCGTAIATPNAMAGPHDGSLADPDIRYIGRWDKSASNVYHSYWTGAYLRTGFTGASIGIKLAAGTTLAVSIDGEPLRTVPAGNGVTPLNLGPLNSGEHTLIAGSAGQNEELEFQGLALAPGGETRSLPVRPVVEFIGDSISAGVIGNYCPLTAEALGADRTQISFSRRSLTSGFGCLDDKAGLDTQYFQLKNFNHLNDKPQTEWNFSYTPALIVINLGQNDQCGNEPADIMTASYTDFLTKIRSRFPKAHIAAMRTFGGPYETSIRQAVAARNSAGDPNVHYIDTTGWLKKEDFRDGIHPNDAGNIKVGHRLSPLLRPLLGMKAAPAAVTVGDPKNPAALPQQILSAYLGGANHITIKPGTYTLSNTDRGAITLEGWTGATISAYGVTLILNGFSWPAAAFDLRGASKVTVEGALLSQAEIPFCQGRVTAIGKNADGKTYCDWVPDKGYPAPKLDADKKFPAANVVDAYTRLLKLGIGDFYSLQAEQITGGAFRITGFNGNENISTGDWIVTRYGSAPMKVHLDNSHDCTIKDITMMRNGFAPIFETGGGGNHILHCKWALGPKPQGATEAPLITNAADGLHSTGTDIGPDIEDCAMEGVFLDDNFAIHGSLQNIKSAMGSVLTLEGGIGNLAAGQPVRISDTKGFYADGMVTALKENGDKTTTVTLDKDLNVPAGAKLSNPLRNGAGYKIVRCRLGRTRSRGILVKADNGLIADNIVEACGMSAVSIGPEYYWGEADYTHHVTVEGNTFRENGKAGYGGSAVLIHGDGAIGNQDIATRKNHFISSYQGDIQAEWVERLTIDANDFAGVPTLPAGTTKYSSINLANSRSVTLNANTVHNSASYKSDLLSIGANVTSLQNPPATGLRDGGDAK